MNLFFTLYLPNEYFCNVDGLIQLRRECLKILMFGGIDVFMGISAYEGNWA